MSGQGQVTVHVRARSMQVISRAVHVKVRLCSDHGKGNVQSKSSHHQVKVRSRSVQGQVKDMLKM